jgi:hypothetical protein
MKSHDRFYLFMFCAFAGAAIGCLIALAIIV